jgi:hypothetical protein
LYAGVAITVPRSGTLLTTPDDREVRPDRRRDRRDDLRREAGALGDALAVIAMFRRLGPARKN